jgi:hypothetical protein
VTAFRASAAALLLLCGCGDPAPEPRSSPASESRRIEALSAEAARMARADFAGSVCGPPSTAGRTVAVFATADLCLSCLEAGALLREVTRKGLSVSDRVVVTPAAHAREVCDYLRREKVRWRVVGITGDLLPEPSTPRSIVYFELEPDGRIHRRAHAATPLELQALVVPRAGAAAPASP